jgi:hypothetical protein
MGRPFGWTGIEQQQVIAMRRGRQMLRRRRTAKGMRQIGAQDCLQMPAANQPRGAKRTPIDLRKTHDGFDGGARTGRHLPTRCDNFGFRGSVEQHTVIQHPNGPPCISSDGISPLYPVLLYFSIKCSPANPQKFRRFGNASFGSVEGFQDQFSLPDIHSQGLNPIASADIA